MTFGIPKKKEWAKIFFITNIKLSEPIGVCNMSSTICKELLKGSVFGVISAQQQQWQLQYYLFVQNVQDTYRPRFVLSLFFVHLFLYAILEFILLLQHEALLCILQAFTVSIYRHLVFMQLEYSLLSVFFMSSFSIFCRLVL